MPFKIGETVRLKSGGPDMSVEAALSSGSFRCQWFAGKKLEHGVFAAETLERVPKDDKK